MITELSEQMYSKACNLIPGGVNSPVRACNSVGCNPRFINKAAGSRVYDVDGNEYIDFVCSWGPMILGHNHPAVVEAIQEALKKGTSFGAPCEEEIELAELVTNALPSVDMVRFVNSGTEATMSAARLARAYTGKKVVVKFDGCYHGHADSFLVKAGSGVATLGIPGSPGVPEDIVRNTISIPYNDLDTLEQTLKDDSLDIACVILEPMAGNMGVVPPAPGFLEKIRRLTTELGIVLIFDEVISGFRLSYGGAQERYNVRPDLTCLGKIIGGGLPVGAYGGKKEIMEQVAPEGPVYQAGTLAGNPLAMSAGRATLQLLQEPGFYDKLEDKAANFAKDLSALADKYFDGKITLNRVGSALTSFFCEEPVTDFESATKSDTEKYGAFYREMLNNGIYLASSQFECTFISAAQSKDDLDKALEVAEQTFKKL